MRASVLAGAGGGQVNLVGEDEEDEDKLSTRFSLTNDEWFHLDGATGDKSSIERELALPGGGGHN